MAAATIAGVVLANLYLTKDTSSNTPQEVKLPTPITNEANQPQTYRINTQCEAVYGMVKSKYPDGEQIPRLQMDNLVEKYPDELKPWKETLQDPQKRKAFVDAGVPPEFNQVLVPIMMKEFSINPELKSTVMLITEPQAGAKLKQIYDENGCKEFFAQRDNMTNPTP